ncbi:hypothetical protein NBE98_13090 [Clostridium swellfunianum]|uniref:hypothetical protein n=1 Tax=Clostridium swellfunianum TaxID=1367462 RepID=UPI00202FAB7C|nr:hypothetical protein [Clostridium swellfunianum]MCM0649307.1 hypothetical protein [Clostridium swellfunianum]
MFNKITCNKKILTSLILVGTLSIGAGIGTYAAFTAKVKSVNNKIETVTYTINNKVGEQKFELFTLNDAVPGSVESLKPLRAEVTGNKSMKINPELILTVKKRSIVDNELSETATPLVLDTESDKAKYFEINTVVKFGDETIFDSKGEFLPIKDLMDAINNSETKELSKNGTFIIEQGEVRINSSAENDYQGASVEAELNLTTEDLVASK